MNCYISTTTRLSSSTQNASKQRSSPQQRPKHLRVHLNFDHVERKRCLFHSPLQQLFIWNQIWYQKHFEAPTSIYTRTSSGKFCCLVSKSWVEFFAKALFKLYQAVAGLLGFMVTNPSLCLGGHLSTLLFVCKAGLLHKALNYEKNIWLLSYQTTVSRKTISRELEMLCPKRLGTGNLIWCMLVTLG